MSLCSSCHIPWSSKIKPAHIPLERGGACVGRWLQLGVSWVMGVEGGGGRKPHQGYCVAACDSITLTGKCRKTRQTHVTGMGWVRVTNSHPVPAPAVTHSTNPHRFVNLWHSLFIINHTHPFGAACTSSNAGMVTNAIIGIWRAKGVFPVPKYKDDLKAFQFPSESGLFFEGEFHYDYDRSEMLHCNHFNKVIRILNWHILPALKFCLKEILLGLVVNTSIT